MFARWRRETDPLIAVRNFVLQDFPEALQEGVRYCEWLFGTCASRRTALRRLASLKSFAAQLHHDGVIAWSLLIAPPLPTAGDRQRNREYESRRPSSDTIARLAASVRRSGGAAALRDSLIVYFVSVLLMRNIELEHVLIADINWTTNQLVVRGSMEPDRRTRHPRVRVRRIPLPTAIVQDLRRWVGIVSSTGAQHLFVRVRGNGRVTPDGLTAVGFYWIIRTWCDRLGIDGLTTRRIRETGITSMLDCTREHDVSAVDVADIAGISSVARLRPRWNRGNVDGQRTAVDAALDAIRPR